MADITFLRTGTGYYVHSKAVLPTDLNLNALLATLFGSVTKGDDGSTILNGTVDPTTEGNDGDFYINTASLKIFGPKATTWPAGVLIKGADGANGADGATVDVADDFADDTTAATGGVAVGGLYHNAGAVRIRLV